MDLFYGDFTKLLFQGLDSTIYPGCKIVIFPDESLHSLSFNSLVASTSPLNFFIDRNEISSCYSASLYEKLNNIAPTGSNHVVFTNPDNKNWTNSKKDNTLGGIKFQPLPETKSISDTAKKLFKEKAYTFSGKSATVENLINADYSKTSTLLLATHGLPATPDANTFEPTIYLSTPKSSESGDTVRLSMLENTKINPQCSFLAACMSGQGELIAGEGPQSFVYGLHKNGSPNVISSLWFVEVHSTVETANAFYKYLKQDKTFSQALRLAQLDVKGKYKHPFFWAPFVLNGIN